MPFERGWQIFRDLYKTHGKELIHSISRYRCIEYDVCRHWNRPSPSEDATGTGKLNPLDSTARLIKIIHLFSPEGARRVARALTDYVDYLDRKAGIKLSEQKRSLRSALGYLLEVSSKLPVAIHNAKHNDLNSIETLLQVLDKVEYAVKTCKAVAERKRRILKGAMDE